MDKVNTVKGNEVKYLKLSQKNYKYKNLNKYFTKSLIYMYDLFIIVYT